jgi:PKD repeat protein
MLRRIVALACAAACLFVAPVVPVHAQNPAVTVSVDVTANRKPINELIYGLAYADAAALADLNCPSNRRGGNHTTRYNWQQNADNRANDWYYESIAYSSATAGDDADQFVNTSRQNGAEPMITIPTIGWVAKLGTNRSKLCSFSIAKYGSQTGNDWQWFPDAGNGIRTTGGYVTGNNPNDASVLVDSTFQQSWVQHLVNRWGGSTAGGVRYYILDNEPSIWHATHRDVFPTGATMEQIRDRMIDYGSKVKDADPGAIVLGPEEWGWSGYIFSGYDQQYGSLHGWSFLPDRAAHGNWDYLPWLLDQLRQNDAATGRRLLDVFTVHYYPQGGEFSNDVSTTMQQRRNRSTRSLWDPNYVDETWINDRVQLVPRIKGWVNTHYPGTRTGITEYNWGAENHINGATAQADIFGIFGREGLDMASRWTTPAASTPTYKAIKMYRNYDGQQSTFGDTSVKATVPNPDTLSAFAAERSSDGALTVMVINKVLSGSTPVTVSIPNFANQGSAQVWQLTAANTISRLSDVTFSGSTISLTVPQQSVTLLVVPASAGGNLPPVARMTATPTSGTAPLAVSFDGWTSSDPDGTIASHSWSFGDGATASGGTATHTYAAPGTYSATLTVMDNAGAVGSTSVTITATAVTIAAPSGLSASVSGRTVTLGWTDNANNESGYYVERAPKGSSSWTRVGTTGANATTFAQTTPKGQWVFRVQGFNGTTTSAYSNQVQARVR